MVFVSHDVRFPATSDRRSRDWKESLESFFKVWKDGEKVLEGLVEVFGHDWRRRRRLWR